MSPPLAVPDAVIVIVIVVAPVDRGQQGAGYGEALHVLRPAGASPVAALAEGAHGLRRPQAAAASLPPGALLAQ